MIDIGKSKISLTCPLCKFINHVTLEDVSKGKSIICNGCLKTIKLVDNEGSTKKAIKTIKQATNDLSNNLKRLSK